MAILQILLGLLAFLLGWLLLYRRNVLFRINAWLRENVFSDNVILFSGRRLAVLLFVLGLVALFSGVDNVVDEQKVTPQMAEAILEQAKRDLQRNQYSRVVNRSRLLVRSQPQNAEAWELLASAWWAMGEKDKAREAVKALLRLQPDHSLKSLLSKDADGGTPR